MSLSPVFIISRPRGESQDEIKTTDNIKQGIKERMDISASPRNTSRPSGATFTLRLATTQRRNRLCGGIVFLYEVTGSHVIRLARVIGGGGYRPCYLEVHLKTQSLLCQNLGHMPRECETKQPESGGSKSLPVKAQSCQHEPRDDALAQQGFRGRTKRLPPASPAAHDSVQDIAQIKFLKSTYLIT